MLELCENECPYNGKCISNGSTKNDAKQSTKIICCFFGEVEVIDEVEKNA